MKKIKKTPLHPLLEILFEEPKPKIPHVIGDNGFWIVLATKLALRRAHFADDVIENYAADAFSDNYDHLIEATMKLVDFR